MNIREKVFRKQQELEIIMDELGKLKAEWVELEHPLKIGDNVISESFDKRISEMVVEKRSVLEFFGTWLWSARGNVPSIGRPGNWSKKVVI